MDELDISGKQYISTRRAGREHGYHSDYIGQLIRGKKVQGQKVGRSWYVDAESLATYLGKDFVAPVKTNTAAPTPAVEEPVAVVEEKAADDVPVVKKEEEKIVVVEPATPVVVAKVEPEPTHRDVVEKEIASTTEDSAQERVVPLHTPAPVIEEKQEKAAQLTGLVYVHDDAPLLPQVRTAMSDEHEATAMAKAAVEHAPRTSLSYSKGIALVSLLGLALVIGVGAAAYISLNVQVVDQTATSYYAVQNK